MTDATLQGTLQIEVTRNIAASQQRVWSIVDDSRLLPQWASAVDNVESCESEGERVGAKRRCRVRLGGRPGYMVERCVERDAPRTIAYVVDEESFGMNRMFDDYGFRLTFKTGRPLPYARDDLHPLHPADHGQPSDELGFDASKANGCGARAPRWSRPSGRGRSAAVPEPATRFSRPRLSPSRHAMNASKGGARSSA